MDIRLSQPQCAVDIYPLEGGKYILQGDGLMECTVTKDLGAEAGAFRIRIAPGGPKGINNPPSWSQIIKPMALAVIAMRRADKVNVVMIGVVRSITDSEEWESSKAVIRSIIIEGADFSYYFTHFNYYSLWYLGAIGLGAGPVNQGIPQILGDGLIIGNPGEVGSQWFSKVMAGTQGVLSKTYVQYQTQRITFPNAVGAFFENYDLNVPYGEFFIGEGTWYEKYREIFPFPYYEFFVTTAGDLTDFANVTSDTKTNVTSLGTKFSTASLGKDVSATPFVVARRNPLPQLTGSVDSGGAPSFDGIDASLWEGLQLFQLDAGGSAFITSSTTFDESQIFNFYSLNPTWMRTLYGESAQSVLPWVYQFAAAGDQASIQRYGFRPAAASFNWMADLTTNIAANNTNAQGDVTKTAGTLLARFASYWEPTSVMAKSAMTTWLRPDIYPGSRFRYNPFKNDVSWDFYISAITHHYSFGEHSTTSLQLVRGLPTSVYNDTGEGGLLFNAHIGNLMVKDGVYTVGTPNGATPLQALSVGQFQDFLANIAQVYVTPQQP